MEVLDPVETAGRRLVLRAKAQKIADVTACVLLLAVPFSKMIRGEWLFRIELGLAVVWLAFSFINARCPHCSALLSWLGKFDHCRDCGLTPKEKGG